MANLTKVFSALGNARTRTFVFLLGTILIVGIGIAIYRSGGETVATTKPSAVTAAPSQLRAVPGGEIPERYRELQKEENIRRAEEAEKTKGSAIPTIIGAASESELEKSLFAAGGAAGQGENQSPFGDLSRGGFEGAGLFNPKGGQATEADSREKRLQEQKDRLEKLRLEKEKQLELERLRKQAEKEQQVFTASVQQTAQAMSQQAEKVSQNWRQFPEQNYVQGVLATQKSDETDAETAKAVLVPGKEGEEEKTTKEGPQEPGAIKKTYIKTGAIMFGILDTAINSDEPGPILATIVHGKYKGGKLLGQFEHQKPYGESVILRFKTLTLPTHEKSIAVDAVAIDPDTARTALSSEVNHHYLLRYGTLFASSFIEGYGKAVGQQGTITTSPNGTTQETKPELTGQDQFLAALGNVGEKWSKQVEPIFKTPYTVEVNQGLGIGLLFMSDVDVTKK
ncbi:MAG TPA: TrbI/VirB10 family protein [Gammaproteobacteria bacterium]|nr:TrbI/VirB10 family protein [Gammaproteobacteria bacterium]